MKLDGFQFGGKPAWRECGRMVAKSAAPHWGASHLPIKNAAAAQPAPGAGLPTRPSTLVASSAAHAAAVAFEGLLFAQALKPLAKPMGFFGETVVSAVSQRIAERFGGTLQTRLEALAERTP